MSENQAGGTVELVRELPPGLRGRDFVPGRVIRGEIRRWNGADGADAANAAEFAAGVADLIRQMQRGGVR